MINKKHITEGAYFHNAKGDAVKVGIKPFLIDEDVKPLTQEIEMPYNRILLTKFWTNKLGVKIAEERTNHIVYEYKGFYLFHYTFEKSFKLTFGGKIIRYVDQLQALLHLVDDLENDNRTV